MINGAAYQMILEDLIDQHYLSKRTDITSICTLIEKHFMPQFEHKKRGFDLNDTRKEFRFLIPGLLPN
jgi:hypothetical protein